MFTARYGLGVYIYIGQFNESVLIRSLVKGDAPRL